MGNKESGRVTGGKAFLHLKGVCRKRGNVFSDWEKISSIWVAFRPFRVWSVIAEQWAVQRWCFARDCGKKVKNSPDKGFPSICVMVDNATWYTEYEELKKRCSICYKKVVLKYMGNVSVAEEILMNGSITWEAHDRAKGIDYKRVSCTGLER